MKNITLLDEKFDINKTFNFHLSIMVSLDGYSFSILDIPTNKFICIKNFNFHKNFDYIEKIPTDSKFCDKIKEVFNEDEFLNKEYKSIKFSFITRKSILIPNELFDKENVKKYFEFNHPLEETESLNINKLTSLDAYLVFTVPSFISTILVNKYKKIGFYHQAMPLIEYICNKQNKYTGDQKKVYVNLYKDFFEVFVISKNGLLLYNCYDSDNENDFVYYILNVYQQLNLQQEVDELIFSGNIVSTSANYTKISSFIKNISFLKLNNTYQYSKAFNEVPEHSFVNLLNLYGCE